MKRLALLVSVVAGFSLLASAVAEAVITIGPNPLPGRTAVLSGGPAATLVNTSAEGALLTSPMEGVVIRWRAQRTDGPGGMQPDTIRLRVLHPTGIPGQFIGAGTSDPHSLPGDPDPIGVREFTTNLPIRVNDYIGYDSSSDYIPVASSLYGSFLSGDAFSDGQTSSFSSNPGYYELINADVEPAMTSITGAPKARVKTRKRKARVIFSFSSNASGVGFSCSLDGVASACASPASYRVRPGSHGFQVQATYMGRSFGPSTSDTFRVKRKR